MTIMKDIEGGRPPVDIEIVDDELPGVGVMLIYGGPHFVTAPPELGGGRANIVNRVSVECCCGTEHLATLIETDKELNGKKLGVICCEVTGQYIWVQLPEDTEE